MNRNMRDYPIPREWRSSTRKSLPLAFSEDIMRFCAVYSIVCTAFSIAKVTSIFASAFLLLAGLLATTVNSMRTKKMWTFVLIQIVICICVAAPPFVLPVRLTFAIFMLILSSISIHSKYVEYKAYLDEGKKFENSYLQYTSLLIMAFLIFAAILVSGHFKLAGAATACTISFIVLISVFTAYYHLSGSNCLTNEEKSSNRAVRQFSGLFAAATAAFMAVVCGILYWLESISGIDRLKPPSFNIKIRNSDQKPKNIQHLGTASSKMHLPSDKKPAPIALKIFWEILAVVIALAIAALLILAIFFIIREAFRFLRSDRTSDVKTENVFSIDKTRQNIQGRIKKLKKMINPFRGSSNSLRIRSLYCGLVKRQIRAGAGITQSDTPHQIGAKLPEEFDTQIITGIYEKARYGPEECSPSDLSIFKENVKKRR